MKQPCTPPAIALAAILQLFTIHSYLSTACAAVPLGWTVRPGQPAPVMFDRYHGETLAFSASFLGFGALPFDPGADVRLWYQTNGMGSAWWSAPATVSSNVLSATWSPELDPGAERVALFFGAPSNAYAAAVLRLRHSPGFTPATPPPPASFAESDPVFAAWLATYTPPETSLEPATNYVDRVAETRRGKTDLVVYTNAVSYGDWTLRSGTGGEGFTIVDVFWDPDEDAGRPYWTLVFDDVEAWHGTDCVEGDESATLLSFAPNGFYVELARAVVTNAVPTRDRIARETDLPDMAAIERDIADIRTENALVYRLYQGSNVVAEVTNYNSQVHAPELRLLQLNESNEYITVWTETNGLKRTLASAKKYTDDALGELGDVYAPKAWSKTTAGMGVEAPSNTTWLSTGRTVIAGGLEYEKHVTSNGAIWLLESNGMTADFHPQTNNTAFLDLSNADGTPIFRVEKTDRFIVGVHVDAVTVDGSALVCHVPVVANEHPLVRVRATLTEGDWTKEEDGIPASLATVTWSGSVGDWTCRIQNNTGGSSFFAQMEYLQEGGTKIVNSAPLDVSQGIICTDGLHKVRPVYANGAITWEVVP